MDIDNRYNGQENNMLKCKDCGKFMTYKGKTKTFDSHCDNYDCKCGQSAQVTDMHGIEQIFWSN